MDRTRSFFVLSVRFAVPLPLQIRQTYPNPHATHNGQPRRTCSAMRCVSCSMFMASFKNSAAAFMEIHRMKV